MEEAGAMPSFDGVPGQGLRWTGPLAFIKHLHGGMSHHTGFLILKVLEGWHDSSLLQMEKQRLGGLEVG